MIRVVVHAGFHKTGTTSVQRFFQTNAALLRPHLRLGLNHALRDVIQAARGYSRWREPLGLAQFEYRLAGFLDGLALEQGAKLLLSVEEFAGLLPGLPARVGEPEIVDYGGAPRLAAVIRDLVSARLSPGEEMVFYYTTRAPEAWLTSVYWQHVKTQKMCDALEDFSARFRPIADLEATIEAVGAALPGIKIVSNPLETAHSLEFGPATPLLDLLDLPAGIRAVLQDVPPANPAPPAEALARMLALNRGALEGAALKAAKLAIEAEYAR